MRNSQPSLDDWWQISTCEVSFIFNNTILPTEHVSVRISNLAGFLSGGESKGRQMTIFLVVDAFKKLLGLCPCWSALEILSKLQLLIFFSVQDPLKQKKELIFSYPFGHSLTSLFIILV